MMKAKDLESPENDKPHTHRLFLGAPVELVVGNQIYAWAKECFDDSEVRLVDPERMHIALTFYPKATDEERDLMVALTSKIEWTPLLARTSVVELTKQSGIAFGVELRPHDSEILDDRLVRASWSAAPEDIDKLTAYHSRLRAEPLGEISLMQDYFIWDMRRRDHRHKRDLMFHLTFARTKKRGERPLARTQIPRFEFSLDRLHLYESHLAPEGVKHEVLATSISI